MGNTLCTCHEIDSQGDRIESSELGKLYRKVSIVRSAQTASIKNATLGVDGWAGRGTSCDGNNGMCNGYGSDCPQMIPSGPDQDGNFDKNPKLPNNSKSFSSQTDLSKLQVPLHRGRIHTSKSSLELSNYPTIYEDSVATTGLSS